MSGLVLSLFPGADLFGMAFEQLGFCVVRGPDVLLGGDIRIWHAMSDRFDGVIGGPPCKSFSQAISSRGGADGATQGNLIPEFERIVHEARPKWFVMENVPEAPKPQLEPLYDVLVDAWAVGASQHRTRRFSSNLELAKYIQYTPEAERHPDPWPTVTATEYKCSAGSNQRVMRQRAGRKVGRRLTLEEVNEAMGLPKEWATPALTMAMSYQVRGNGVPLPLGMAIARAVWLATEEDRWIRASIQS